MKVSLSSALFVLLALSSCKKEEPVKVAEYPITYTFTQSANLSQIRLFTKTEEIQVGSSEMAQHSDLVNAAQYLEDYDEYLTDIQVTLLSASRMVIRDEFSFIDTVNYTRNEDYIIDEDGTTFKTSPGALTFSKFIGVTRDKVPSNPDLYSFEGFIKKEGFKAAVQSTMVPGDTVAARSYDLLLITPLPI